ncbi:MAG: Putative malate dehydrogenase, similar to archaeal MJ1425, partial [uncultured Gemmatimonadetes bacterium]
ERDRSAEDPARHGGTDVRARAAARVHLARAADVRGAGRGRGAGGGRAEQRGPARHRHPWGGPAAAVRGDARAGAHQPAPAHPDGAGNARHGHGGRRQRAGAGGGPARQRAGDGKGGARGDRVGGRGEQQPLRGGRVLPAAGAAARADRLGDDQLPAAGGAAVGRREDAGDQPPGDRVPRAGGAARGHRPHHQRLRLRQGGGRRAPGSLHPRGVRRRPRRPDDHRSACHAERRRAPAAGVRPRAGRAQGVLPGGDGRPALRTPGRCQLGALRAALPRAPGATGAHRGQGGGAPVRRAAGGRVRRSGGVRTPGGRLDPHPPGDPARRGHFGPHDPRRSQSPCGRGAAAGGGPRHPAGGGGAGARRPGNGRPPRL